MLVEILSATFEVVSPASPDGVRDELKEWVEEGESEQRTGGGPAQVEVFQRPAQGRHTLLLTTAVAGIVGQARQPPSRVFFGRFEKETQWPASGQENAQPHTGIAARGQVQYRLIWLLKETLSVFDQQSVPPTGPVGSGGH